MKRYLHLLLVVLVLLTAACSEPAHDPAAGNGTRYTCPMHPQVVQDKPGTCPICHMDLVPVTRSAGDDGALMLSPRQIALANITVKRVKTGALGNHTLLTGKLVLDETRTDVVSSRAAGRIEKLYIKASGQQVRQGQPLYVLYSEALLTLQREYLLALRQHQELGKENPRFVTFLEGARQKLLLYGLTPAQIRTLGRTGKMDARVTFVAPATGVITEVAAAEGQYIAEGALLYRLSRLGKLWVEAELYPREVSAIKVGDAVQVSLPGTPAPLPAKVSFLSPEFRAGSQVVLLRAEIANPEGQYLPGMPAQVRLPAQAGSATITLPADAVLRDEHGAHVWVQSGKSTFRSRMVTLGEESAENVEILSGLEENEKVVTSGAYLLYSEYVLKKGAEPMAGHIH